MSVRKKILDTPESHGSIDLASKLKRVRDAISTLLTEDEGADMNNEPNTENASTEAAAPKGPRKVTKKASTKKVVKKVAAKKSEKSNGTAKAEAGTTLAAICKKVKGMEPRRARRILRGAEGVPEAGARWTWTRAADVAKVEKILKDADAE